MKGGLKYFNPPLMHTNRVSNQSAKPPLIQAVSQISPQNLFSCIQTLSQISPQNLPSYKPCLKSVRKTSSHAYKPCLKSVSKTSSHAYKPCLKSVSKTSSHAYKPCLKSVSKTSSHTDLFSNHSAKPISTQTQNKTYMYTQTSDTNFRRVSPFNVIAVKRTHEARACMLVSSAILIC